MGKGKKARKKKARQEKRERQRRKNHPFTHRDPWTKAIKRVLAELPPSEASAGLAAVTLATTATGARPTRRFLDQATALRDEYGAPLARAVRAILEGSALTPSYERGILEPQTGDAVRALCWIASLLRREEELAPAVARWFGVGWTRVPGYGPASRRAANGVLWALPRMGHPGAAQLGRIRSVAKLPQAAQAVDAAIGEAAAAMGIPVEEFEELVAPTYGLDAGTRKDVVLGDFTATLAYARGKTSITITDATGRVRKTVPVAIRRDHADELAALRALAKEVAIMLAAQRLRLERLLLTERSWPLDLWRERYADHPLVSAIARNLIWELTEGDETRVVTAVDGVLRDITGAAVEPAADAVVRLWHPATAPPSEVAAWRLRIEQLGVVQPFKQAHREVYLLTDAERQTEVYSNRFAAHILRQHQFSALAKGRGWRYTLQGWWGTSDGQAILELPQHDLVAALWTDIPAEDEQDWNDAGIHFHVATDQVRFTRAGTEDAVPLSEVPIRVFSEVMRDVDLFVGVASIGNDPTWLDGGVERRPGWRGYWHDASFGDLGVAAESRRDLLSRLLPKLAIAEVASLDGRFLVVQGTYRSYKIHLGSGNILMTPNNEYLCIVPSRKDDDAGGVMLPFEGDRKLSIVLSKAMLLARDDQITDKTITSQILRR